MSRLKIKQNIGLLGLLFFLSACSGGGSSGGDDGGGGDDNPSAAAKTTVIPSGDADCPSGGILVETGIDENGNGVLDAAEVDASEKVCNGAPGADGADGAQGPAGVDGSDGATGPQGPAGANGADGTNGTDGVDGANGLNALVETTAEPAGTNCANGGIRIDAGLDANGNGGLDSGEFTTTYACNGSDGTNGADGATGPQGPAGADGADGANWWDSLGATGALEGYVYREVGASAEGAVVTIAGTPHYAFADGFGYYRFDYIAVGHKNINISLDGYFTQHLQDQPVTAGGTTTARQVRLNKKRLPLPARLSLANVKAFSGQAASDKSGRSVAGAGDVNGDGFDDILIAAYTADPGGNSNAGESYLVYGRPGLDLSQIVGQDLGVVADVTFIGQAVSDYSGISVAGVGDVNGDGYDDILIGAYGADPGGITDAGESYLIYGGPALPASLALSSADVVLSGAVAGDRSGDSVAGAGDVNADGYDDFIVGAFMADPGGNADAGESYLIYGGPSLSASLNLSSADVILSGAAAGDWSGHSLAGAGDVNGDGYDDLLIGALWADPGGNSGAGESYLVYGSPSLPASLSLSSADVILSGAATGDLSGISTAGAGDVNGDGYDDILIGAINADPGGLTDAGESYLIYGGLSLPSSLLLNSADVILRGVAAGDEAGTSVAGASDVNADGYNDILIGAKYADPRGSSNAGESYLLYGGPSLPANLALSDADITFGGVATDDLSGISLAGAGDVNGDGFDDILIGAYGADPVGNSNAGESYLILGRPRGVDTAANQLNGNYSLVMADGRFMGAATGDRSGISVADAGDVNGDGYDDILIGAVFADSGGNTDAGESYLVYGRPGMDINQALGMEADVTFTGVAVNDQSARSASGAGDVNGDGYDDILIGADRADPGGNLDAGESYLIYGGTGLPANLPLSNADVTLIGVAAGDYSGRSVSGAGDVNGDGYDDILIGAYSANPGSLDFAGESYLVYGGPALPVSLALSSADVIFSGAAEDDESGTSVSGAGDVNGDGYDDILIGAFGANSASGESYLVYGGTALPASLVLSSADVIFSGVVAGDESGTSVAGAGDVNGDGYDDILIGAYNANSSTGESYLVYGGPGLSASLVLSSADVTFSGVAAGDFNGSSVSGAGDINGDGFGDILFGAHGVDPGGNTGAGESYLIYGGPGLPASLALSSADVTLSGVAMNDSSGRSVSGAGDVNGDGFDDILVGAHGANLSGNNVAGNTYLFLGQGSHPVE